MKTEEFQNLLSLYGSDLSTWPEDVWRNAIAAIGANPALNDLILSERRFEEIAKSRRVPEVDGFAARIIAAAAREEPAPHVVAARSGFRGFWFDLRQMLPAAAPSYAMLSVAVVVGFALGWIVKADSTNDTLLQSVLYVTGGMV